MSPRRASIHNKRDANEAGIVEALAEMKVIWTEGGPLDGWIWLREFIPVEIKNPKGLNKMRPNQAGFIERCKYLGWPYLVLRSVEDAINSVNALRRQ